MYGLAAAAAIAVSTPALAQVGFYAGPGGAGIEFGAPYSRYYDHDYYRWDRGQHEGWYRNHHWEHRSHHRDYRDW
jgi:hypothetical protein